MGARSDRRRYYERNPLRDRIFARLIAERIPRLPAVGRQRGCFANGERLHLTLESGQRNPTDDVLLEHEVHQHDRYYRQRPIVDASGRRCYSGDADVPLAGVLDLLLAYRDLRTLPTCPGRR